MITKEGLKCVSMVPGVQCATPLGEYKKQI